jgi:hypothetical protein
VLESGIRASRGSRTIALAIAIGLTLGGVGCGSDDSEEPDTTAGADKSSEQAPGGPAPDELVGTYEVTLKASDLPASPPVELTDGSMSWELKIANSGGTGGGRSFAISNKSLGLLEDPSFAVEGDSIVLEDEECATESGGYEYFDNEYRYDLQGESLTFTTVSNSCPDQVAETILTSSPWTRVR